MDLDVEAYAALMAELAAAGDARAEVLERHGLDESRWDAIDTLWQDRLSDAVDVEDDGVPEIVTRYATAYQEAQRTFADLLTVEQFARVTRLLGATGDLRAALARSGVKLAEFVRAGEHWSRRIAEDPDVEHAFEDALREG